MCWAAEVGGGMSRLTNQYDVLFKNVMNCRRLGLLLHARQVVTTLKDLCLASVRIAAVSQAGLLQPITWKPGSVFTTVLKKEDHLFMLFQILQFHSV